MDTSAVRWACLPFLLLACTQNPNEGGRIVPVDRGAYNPSISPDGSTIAVGILGKIWLLPAEGGDARQLTSGYGWDHHPAWAPDGEHLAYVHDTPTSSEIVIHTLGTGTFRTLYGRPGAAAVGSSSWGTAYSFGELAFHPATDSLYFVDFRSGIRSVALAGRTRQPVQFLPGSGRRPGRPGITERSSFAFAPDGRSLVVEKDTTNLWTDLHVAPLDTKDLRQVTVSDTVRRTDVAWSPDGASFVYLELDHGHERIAIHTLASGEIRRIALGPFNGRELALHPDGDHAVVVSGRRLFMVNLATGAVAPVPFRAVFSLPSRSPGDLVITNARLFDGTGADVMEQATVRVRSGTIVDVTTGSASDGAGARVIDAGGRFLMPGLVASHSHLWVGSNLTHGATLTRGITSQFDPGSYLPETLNLRDAIDLGILEGPHIYTTGPTIDGPEGRARPLTVANVSDTDDVRALVRELHAAGVDAVKLYAFLEPAPLAAAIDEAHGLGLPAIGDLITTPWSVALDARIDGLVHFLDSKWRFISQERPDPEGDPLAVVEPDSVQIDAFFARVAAQGAMFDPTVVAASRYFDAGDFAAAVREGLGDPSSVYRARILAAMVRAMHHHGVRWVAGSDTGPFDLLDELEIYEIIGIPNADILQTATVNPARWLKKADFGTVEPGMRADLILIDGDPLERIRDLENVVLVVQSGRVAFER